MNRVHKLMNGSFVIYCVKALFILDANVKNRNKKFKFDAFETIVVLN